ncbi:MAG: death-on-curing family protein [Parcubacteria group bacterium Athens0714_25]|nr:MAG: death-on-curing family protein [Parcubacteria group bacterium Athens0714_25]
MTKELNNKIIIYSTEDGQTEIEVNLDGETIWLSQKQMAELFDKDRKTITEHIGNVFKEGELLENSVCRKFQHTALDGKTYNINHYNLDVIISVGYRVKSLRGTQ